MPVLSAAYPSGPRGRIANPLSVGSNPTAAFLAGPVLLFTDDRLLSHVVGPGHPERPQRLSAISEELSRLPPGLARIKSAEPATRAELERVHSARHIDAIEAFRGRNRFVIDEDTAGNEHSVGCAYLAAGCALRAAEAAMRADGPAAWALVRPPGHHAERQRAMGFCLFNNIAAGAAHAIANLGCRRVLIVDWDVHHGNGTEEIFRSRRDVLFFDTHQHPFWPGSGAAEDAGEGAGRGFTVNVPLPSGRTDGDYFRVFDELLVPMARQFKPDLVLVSAGFDSHRDDPIGGMRVTESGFATMAGIVQGLARDLAGGRLGLVLEGGYDLGGLSRGIRSCIDVLGGSPAPRIEVEADGETLRVIERVKSVHREFWEL